MRRFFRWVVRGLVVIVVFMASMLTAMRFAIHGRQTAVPKVVGMTSHDAETALAAHGLVLDRSDRFFSAEIPEGHIVSQLPAPNEVVRRGWRVRVAESMGPQRVTIPDLTGDSERSAEINIKRRGLEMGAMAVADVPDAAPDQVVAQSPPANATNVSAPKVSVLVAATPDRKSYVMPDLHGRTEDEAIDAIVRAGLKVGSITSQPAPGAEADSPETMPAGSRIIVRTAPGTGQRVWEGQAVNLEVTR
ncbi:MAG TPA: PASTA domain-containing protein [Candidatus Angelobacter sp.]|jgi:beta-lactam-binding protein with PASTA domain|nr:PASTA domain-containing protein [Candidatus Angelobacter sp.]